jgi:hypothetical protein
MVPVPCCQQKAKFPHRIRGWIVIAAAGASFLIHSLPGTRADPSEQQEQGATASAENVDSEKKLDVKKHALIAEAARSYHVHLGADVTEQSEAKLLETPLLRWTNPVEDATDGAVFAWVTDEGRPLAMACLYEFPGRKRIDHEFVSLSPEPLAAVRRNHVVWTPEKNSVQFQRLPGNVEPPAARAAQRLTQMRNMTRRFGGSVDIWQRGKTVLRFLPKPLYRYGKEDSAILDGAVFSLTQGTDPEILLILEARAGADSPAWHYAAARMSSNPLELQLDEKPVWKVDAKWERNESPAQPYVTFWKNSWKE